MEEDEDVLFENKFVHNHLRENGFLSVETKSAGNVFDFTNPPKRNEFKRQCSGKDNYVSQEVLAIKSANLLFEDDLSHIENVLSNVELGRDEHLKYIFRGSACAIVIAAGLLLYLIIGVYAIFFITIYYTYRATNFLWNRRSRLKVLDQLLSTMKSNLSLLNKILKFLHENENMIKLRLGSNGNEIAATNLLALQSSLRQHQNKVNRIYSNATCTLLTDLPLLEDIDDPDNYICKSTECYADVESILQQYNICMLLQSQFLTRLIFSFTPNLHLTKTDSDVLIYKTIYKISAHLQDLNMSLSKKFIPVLVNGIYPNQNRMGRPLEKQKPERHSSVPMLVRNIHDLSNSLQYSLIKARELETNLEADKTVNTGEELEAIQRELTICQSHISDLLILQNKSKPPQSQEELELDNCVSHCEFATVSELGYPDLDPKVDDDIFEAIISDSPDVRDIFLCDEEDMIDPLAKKKRKQMMDELKSRLKNKAEEWSQREMLIRARKGMPLPEKPLSSHEDSLSDSSECERPINRKTYREKYGDSSSDEEFDNKPDIDFQKSLLQIRANFIPQTEYYCADDCEEENSN